MHGTDSAIGIEPGKPVVHRIVGPKDAALERAEAAGLQVLVGRYSVEKYDRVLAPENLYEVVECPPNLFLTAGVTRLWELVTGVSSVHLDNATARLAVGDSSTAAAVGDVDLLGANKFRKLANQGSSPTIAGRQVTYSAQFTTGEANFAWLEVGVGWAASGNNTLLSRSAIGAPGLGTKVNTAVWVLNWTLGISSTAG
jgi:hypothetical protein